MKDRQATEQPSSRTFTPAYVHTLLGAVLLSLACVGCTRTVRPTAYQGPLVRWMWSGAVTPTTATVVAQLRQPQDSVRVVFSQTPRFDVAVASVWTPAPRGPLSADATVRLPVRGLIPGTDYFYAVETPSLRDMAFGRMSTPPNGPHSFMFAAGACAETGSRSSVFDSIRALGPDFFFHLGDAHYENIEENDVGVFGEALDAMLTSPTQSLLYQSTPIAYTWDDHDFGPNDSDATSPSRAASRIAYQRFVPHYPLQDRDAAPEDRAIYQTFVRGRVRFVVTDLRSERDPHDIPLAERSMLGAQQRAWFEQTLRDATEPLVIWVSGVPWIAEADEDGDNWSGYAAERAELVAFFEEIDIARRMVILSGDAHMIAADDGTHSPGGIPVLQAAPLDRRGSIKGGPYTHGPFAPPIFSMTNTFDGQFGLVTVEDEGGSELCLTFSGRRLDRSDDEVEELLRLTRCFQVPDRLFDGPVFRGPPPPDGGS
ncbi:MAG: alkaline phosphatase D family protein [Bacteroidota bacterium]